MTHTRHAYHVTFFYREPTYELRAGRSGTIYRGSFDVRAYSSSEAEQLARREFNHWAFMSNVGWPREIVRVECEVRDSELE